MRLVTVVIYQYTDDEDYGLTGFSGGEGQAEPSLEQQLAAGGRTAAAGGAVEVETVDKDVAALTSGGEECLRGGAWGWGF